MGEKRKIKRDISQTYNPSEFVSGGYLGLEQGLALSKAGFNIPKKISFDELYKEKKETKTVSFDELYNKKKKEKPATFDELYKETEELAKEDDTHYIEALQSGLKSSNIGKLFTGELSEFQPEGITEEIIQTAGHIAGNIPTMAAGFFVGGANPITGTAGAFALPEVIDKMLTRQIQKKKPPETMAEANELLKEYVFDVGWEWNKGAMFGQAALSKNVVKKVAGEAASLLVADTVKTKTFPTVNDVAKTFVMVGALNAVPKISAKFKKIKENIGKAEKGELYTTKSPKPPPILLKEQMEQAYTEVVNQWYPIKKIGRELGERGDATYEAAIRLQGVAGMAETMLVKEQYKFHNKEIITGKGLHSILKPVENKLGGVKDYMLARHGLGLKNPEKQIGFTKEKLKEVEQRYVNNPAIKKAHKDLQKYQDNILDYAVDSGLFSKEAAGRMRVKYKEFAHVYRAKVKEGKSLGKGIGNAGKGIKRRGEGSNLPILDPIESMVKQTYTIINVAERNRIAQAVADFSKMPGGEKWVRKRLKKMIPIKVKADEVIGKFSKDPEITVEMKSLINALGEESATIFRPKAFTPEENVIRVWEKGKSVEYDVHPLLYKASSFMDAETANFFKKIIMTAATAPAKSLRAGSVVMNPEFFLAKNPFRDQITAFIGSRAGKGVGYIPFVDGAKGLMSLIKKDRDYWDYKKYGGEHASLVSMDRTYLRMKMNDIIEGKIKLKNVVNPLEAARILGEATESMTRIGEAKKIIRKGIKKGVDPQEIKQKAAFAGKEVSVNFSIKGANKTIQALNAMTAFMNPAIQDISKFARLHKQNPVATTGRALAAITAPALILWNENKDKEWYKNIDQWQKDLFYLIAIGGTGRKPDIILRIPKPFTFGLTYGSVPERVADYMYEKNPHKMKKLTESLVESFAPPVMPNIIKTPLELMTNYSFFFEKNIQPYGSKNLQPEARRHPYDPEILKKIGSMTNLSPSALGYGIYSTTGGMGRSVVKLVDKVYKTVKKYSKEKGVKIEEPESTLADYFLIGSLVARYPSPSSSGVDELYRNVKEISSVYETFKHYALVERNVEAALEYFNKNIKTLNYAVTGNADAGKGFENITTQISLTEELSKSDKKIEVDNSYKLSAAMALNVIRMQLSLTNKAINAIIQAPVTVLTGKEKREKLDNLYIDRANLARRVNDEVYKLKEEAERNDK